MNKRALYIKLLLTTVLSVIIPTIGNANKWSVNEYEYRYDMFVYAAIVNDGNRVEDYSDCEIAAFVDGKCRGVGEIQSKNGHDWIYLRIHSNVAEGDIVQFKMFKINENKEIVLMADNPVIFKADETLGLPSVPIQLSEPKVYSFSVVASDDSMGSVSKNTDASELVGGTNISVTAKPANGYSFVGWICNGDTVSSDNPYIFTINKDTKLVAVFKVNNYRLQYLVEGKMYKEYINEYGSNIIPEIEPEKEGYTFSGWNGIPSTMPASDVIVTGYFIVNKYKLTYIVDRETYMEQQITYGSTIQPIDVPEKEGYTFSGWNDIPSTMPASDVIVTGYFVVNKYKLTYIVDGEIYKEQQITYGSTIQPIDVPEKEGYTFTGWEPEIPAFMPACDISVKAVWTVHKHRITFLSDDGKTVIKDNYLDYGDKIVIPDDPYKMGYTFTGWIPEVKSVVPDEDIIYTATFIINPETIINPVIVSETEITEKNIEQIIMFKITMSEAVESFLVNDEAKAELYINESLEGIANYDAIKVEDDAIVVCFNPVVESSAHGLINSFNGRIKESITDKIAVSVKIVANSFTINGENLTDNIIYNYSAKKESAEKLIIALDVDCVKSDCCDKESMYRLNGTRVDNNTYKGIIIKNGGKYIIKN